MSGLPNNSESIPFPLIDEAFLDSQLENNTNQGIGGIYDVTASNIQGLMDSPIDSFLFNLAKNNIPIDLIIETIESTSSTAYLIEKYHNHWLKIKKLINEPIKMLELLSQSFLQNIEDRPNYKQEGFDREYMKIIVFLQSMYQKTP